MLIEIWRFTPHRVNSFNIIIIMYDIYKYNFYQKRYSVLIVKFTFILLPTTPSPLHKEDEIK